MKFEDWDRTIPVLVMLVFMIVLVLIFIDTAWSHIAAVVVSCLTAIIIYIWERFCE